MPFPWTFESAVSPADLLLDRTGYVGEDIVSVGADQPYGANHDHQNYGQHDRILRDVLPGFFAPQPTHTFYKHCVFSHHSLNKIERIGGREPIWDLNMARRQSSYP